MQEVSVGQHGKTRPAAADEKTEREEDREA